MPGLVLSGGGAKPQPLYKGQSRYMYGMLEADILKLPEHEQAAAATLLGMVFAPRTVGSDTLVTLQVASASKSPPPSEQGPDEAREEAREESPKKTLRTS